MNFVRLSKQAINLDNVSFVEYYLDGASPRIEVHFVTSDSKSMSSTGTYKLSVFGEDVTKLDNAIFKGRIDR